MLFRTLENIRFKGKLEIVDCQGHTYKFGEGEDFSKIRFKNKSIEKKIFRNPGLYLGEGYMNQDFIIEEGGLDVFLKIITSSYDDFINNNPAFKTYQNFSSLFK